MAYLVAKYCLVFLCTALLGFLIGRWSVKRLFVDVTDSFQTLCETSRAASEAPWDELRARFDDVNSNVRNIVRNEFRAHPYPEVPRALFTKLEHGLAEIKQTVENLPAPIDVDLSEVNSGLRNVDIAVKNLATDVHNNVAKHDDIDELAQAVERQLTKLAGGIAAIPEPSILPTIDLDPLEKRIAQLQKTVETFPAPPEIDLTRIEAQLDDVARDIESLPNKLPQTSTGMSGVEHQISMLRDDVSLLVKSNAGLTSQRQARQVLSKLEILGDLVAKNAESAAEHFNLTPIDRRLQSLEGAVRTHAVTTQKAIQAIDATEIGNHLGRLESQLDNVSITQARSEAIAAGIDQHLTRFDRELEQLLTQTAESAASFLPLHESVEAISKDLHQMRNSDRDLDGSPLGERLDRMESLLSANQDLQMTAFGPLDRKLDQIQSRLSALNEDVSMTIPENGRRPSIGAKLLKRPEFGRKDRLQEIAGIGPKLEQSLNKLGVYYYWQIAAWDKRDIRAVDANLDAFRGRIERDDWVRQAKSLRENAHAARPPSGREIAQKLN